MEYKVLNKKKNIQNYIINFHFKIASSTELA